MILKLKRKTKEKGFTLIELMIVIAVVGMLAAIAIPRYADYRARGWMSAVRMDAKNAYTAVQTYLANNPDAIPVSRSTKGPGLMQAPYDFARVTAGVTISVADTTGDITGFHANLGGTYVIRGSDGVITDDLSPH
ncbi:MAG TPA: pilin [Deltaproteobacteria bacterium]|nr:pilin [Deltaproteobacteria bacterium]